MLREEHRLGVFENRVLRRIFGPKRDKVTEEWRKLHSEDLNVLYSSPNIILVIKSRRVRWAGHVVRIGEGRGVYRVSDTRVSELRLEITEKKSASCLTKPNENINNTNDCSNCRNINCRYLNIKHYTSINLGFITALLYLKCHTSLPYTNSSYLKHQEQLEVYISNQLCVLSSRHPVRPKHLKYQVQKSQKMPSLILWCRKRINMREERLKNAENILYAYFSLNWYQCSRKKTLCANPNLTRDLEIIVVNTFRFLGNTASYHNNTLLFSALGFPTADLDYRCWHSKRHKH